MTVLTWQVMLHERMRHRRRNIEIEYFFMKTTLYIGDMISLVESSRVIFNLCLSLMTILFSKSHPKKHFRDCATKMAYFLTSTTKRHAPIILILTDALFFYL